MLYLYKFTSTKLKNRDSNYIKTSYKLKLKEAIN